MPSTTQHRAALWVLCLGLLSTSIVHAQDSEPLKRQAVRVTLKTIAAATPAAQDSEEESSKNGLRVRRIIRIPRPGEDPQAVAGFNRPEASKPEPSSNPPGEPMEPGAASEKDAATQEVGQQITLALGAATSEATVDGRRLKRKASKKVTKIPANFVFKSPVRNRRITSRYGMRYHPIPRKHRGKGKKKRKKKLHKGIDYGAPKGTPIVATGPGKVIHSGWGPRGEGLCVFIKHPNNWVSLYLHMSKTSVKVGDTVASGQRIGDIGSTGRSTGPHLHFQVQRNGHTIDPEKVLNRRSNKIKFKH